MQLRHTPPETRPVPTAEITLDLWLVKPTELHLRRGLNAGSPFPQRTH